MQINVNPLFAFGHSSGDTSIPHSTLTAIPMPPLSPCIISPILCSLPFLTCASVPGTQIHPQWDQWQWLSGGGQRDPNGRQSICRGDKEEEAIPVNGSNGRNLLSCDLLRNVSIVTSCANRFPPHCSHSTRAPLPSDKRHWTGCFIDCRLALNSNLKGESPGTEDRGRRGTSSCLCVLIKSQALVVCALHTQTTGGRPLPGHNLNWRLRSYPPTSKYPRANGRMG